MKILSSPDQDKTYGTSWLYDDNLFLGKLDFAEKDKNRPFREDDDREDDD